jgi:hypothetical protein
MSKLNHLSKQFLFDLSQYISRKEAHLRSSLYAGRISEKKMLEYHDVFSEEEIAQVTALCSEKKLCKQMSRALKERAVHMKLFKKIFETQLLMNRSNLREPAE